jgi:zinc transporter ZupT
MISDIPPLVNIVLLSLVASLGTGLGGLIAVIRRPGKRMYGLLMGITAGVMICLSLLDLVNVFCCDLLIFREVVIPVHG